MNTPVFSFPREEPAGMMLAIKAATELAHDLAMARDLYSHEPIAVYKNKTADELVKTGHIDAVLAFLQDLRTGARG